MKGTYIDDTKFYLNVFLSNKKPDREINGVDMDKVIQIPYEKVDGFNIDTFFLLKLKNMVKEKDESPKGYDLHMNLNFYRNITDEKDESDFFNCLSALRFAPDSRYRDLKLEQAFALDIAKKWDKYYHSEKRAALCFLEKYVLPFEAVMEFSKTGKLDMSSFEETYDYAKETCGRRK